MIAIVAGSESDREFVNKCEDALDNLNITHQSFIMSAHRTPDTVREFAMSAHKKGFIAIIAIAGLSNALAGFCASYSDLPVIGVPIASGTLGGLDALLSTVQMPGGVPVVSVGINNAKNAAIFAAKIEGLISGSNSQS